MKNMFRYDLGAWNWKQSDIYFWTTTHVDYVALYDLGVTGSTIHLVPETLQIYVLHIATPQGQLF
jgi:hypothetical protein